MNWDTFLDQFRAWLEARGLLAADQRWVVGASGGPDSSLLLHALLALSERESLAWSIHAAHLHHGLRGAEADADAEFADAMADALNVPFHVDRVDIRAQVERGGGSTEEIARERRYAFLERIALQVGSELVAVAHHADDNVETILHRICRGTGLRGLAGISDLRPIREGSHIRVVRPLLPIRRSAIEALCAARRIESREDSSNRSPEFTRSRVRTRVLPMLREQLNPHVDDAILRLAEFARGMSAYLEDAAARTFESLVIAEDSRHIALNVPALLNKQRIIQSAVVRRALTRIGASEDELSFAHVESVLRLAEDSVSGKELHLPGPLVVRKQYERLEFGPLVRDEPVLEIAPIFVTCPGRTTLAPLGYELHAEVCDVEPGKIDELRSHPNPLEEWLDLDRLRPPLMVRGRRDGDRFRPLGAPGAKTVGDFLGDLKIDPADRARTGVLCDQDGPVWVMPLRIDERVKLRPDSLRALRLMLTPTNFRPSAAE